MKKAALHVHAGRTAVGLLARSTVEPDTVLFGYRPGTEAAGAVSLTMPVRVDQYDAMAGLLPIFEMNLPEGALKERLRLQFAKAIPEFDDLDLLQIVGSSQIGRLRYSPLENLDEAVPAQDLAEVLTHRGTADLFAHLLERFARYSGVSGMQPKVLVREDLPLDKISYRGTTHIVKTFDRAQYPELAANEFICTRGAAAAGLAVPNLALSESRTLLVGRRGHGRYDGSYEQIARRIKDFVSPALVRQSLEKFALMVTYSCSVGNGDAHRKNFSVLYRDPEGEVSLSPAYDIVSTLLYLPRDTLALELGGTKAFPDRARLLKFVREVTGKSAQSGQRLLDQAELGVNKALDEAADYGRRHKAAATFVERLSRVLRSGLERLAA